MRMSFVSAKPHTIAMDADRENPVRRVWQRCDMVQKRKTAGKSTTKTSSAITQERFLRLYRMVELLAAGPHPREKFMHALRLDLRGFYRDLEVLRSAGVSVTSTAGRYVSNQKPADALALLPFPDPHLTLGSARILAKGRTASHRALAERIRTLLPD